jgi:hypothetical protein
MRSMTFAVSHTRSQSGEGFIVAPKI